MRGRERRQAVNPYLPSYEYVPDGRYYLYYAFDFMGRMGVAGFKYFSLGEAAQLPVEMGGEEKTVTAAFQAENGVYPLFFGYFGDGSVDFLSFTLS